MSYVNSGIKSKQISKPAEHKPPPPPKKKRTEGCIFRRGSMRSGSSTREEEEEQSRLKLVARREVNFYQKIYKFIKVDHIHSFFNQLCINEETLRNSDHDESILKTVCQLRTVNKVEISADYVSVFLRTKRAYSHIPYIVERFNSFGDLYYHQLANQLAELNEFFNNQQLLQLVQTQEETPDTIPERELEIARIIETFGGKPYLIRLQPNQFIFSKGLLQLMGKDMQQFAQDCIQFRVIIDDIFTADNYRHLLACNFTFLSYMCRVMRGELARQELMGLSALSYVDTIRGPLETKIKVMIKSFMPNPYCIAMLIEDVLSEETPACIKPSHNASQMKTYLQDLIVDNAETIRALVPLESKYLKADSDKICSYKMIRSKKRKLEQEDDYQI